MGQQTHSISNISYCCFDKPWRVHEILCDRNNYITILPAFSISFCTFRPFAHSSAFLYNNIYAFLIQMSLNYVLKGPNDSWQHVNVFAYIGSRHGLLPTCLQTYTRNNDDSVRWHIHMTPCVFNMIINWANNLLSARSNHLGVVIGEIFYNNNIDLADTLVCESMASSKNFVIVSQIQLSAMFPYTTTRPINAYRY